MLGAGELFVRAVAEDQEEEEDAEAETEGHAETDCGFEGGGEAGGRGGCVCDSQTRGVEGGLGESDV